jgi:hypothetical protein
VYRLWGRRRGCADEPSAAILLQRRRPWEEVEFRGDPEVVRGVDAGVVAGRPIQDQPAVQDAKVPGEGIFIENTSPAGPDVDVQNRSTRTYNPRIKACCVHLYCKSENIFD